MPAWFVLAQTEIEVEAASQAEALIKGQHSLDRYQLDTLRPFHEALRWLAWAVPEDVALASTGVLGGPVEATENRVMGVGMGT